MGRCSSAPNRSWLTPGGLGREHWKRKVHNHCNFTVLGSLDEPRAEAWTRHLMAMDWANTDHRRILELEGLHEWVAPDLDGYRDVFEAVRSQAIDARW